MYVIYVCTINFVIYVLICIYKDKLLRYYLYRKHKTIKISLKKDKKSKFKLELQILEKDDKRQYVWHSEESLINIFFMIVSKNAVCVMIMDGTATFISYIPENKINLSVSARHYLSSPGHKFHRPLHHFIFSHNEA